MSHVGRHVGLALLLTAPLTLGAQRADTDRGFWIGAGLGVGNVGVECANCSSIRNNSVAGHLRFGGTLRRRLRAGFELNAWVRTKGSTDARLAILSGDIRYHPRAIRRLSLRAGLGYIDYLETYRRPDDLRAEIGTRGWTLLAGFSYAFHLTATVSVDPYLTYARQVTGKVEIGAASIEENARADLLQIGLGFTWYQSARD